MGFAITEVKNKALGVACCDFTDSISYSSLKAWMDFPIDTWFVWKQAESVLCDNAHLNKMFDPLL